MNSLDTLLKRIDSLTRRARAHLVWERYAPVLALGICALLIFIAGSFAGVWHRIGDPWRLLALLATVYLLGRSLWQTRRVKAPTRSQARRRVEQDSQLEHRPFDTVRDACAQTGNADDALWTEHSRRAATQAASASPSRLRSVLAPIDKFYLRFAAPVAVILALMLGMGDSFERLRHSLSPSWMSAMDPSEAKYDAWIDPPDYTGRPPLYFKGKSLITAPDGSELVARISGIGTAPRLRIIQDGKTRYVTAQRLGPKSYEARTLISASQRGGPLKARWRIGATPKEWRLDVKLDTPPQIEWAEPPKASDRDQLDFSYNLTDDYGAKTLELELVLGDTPLGLEGFNDTQPVQSERISIDLSAASVRSAQKTNVQINLTKHKWAGKKTRARLIATDFKGQEGVSEFETLIVPDKIFITPLAKAVIENRSLLLAAGKTPYAVAAQRDSRDQPRFAAALPDERINRAPEPVRRAAVLLDAITDSPVGAFKDPVVYMGLKNVQSRVEQAREIGDIFDAPEDLWLIAMRAEFGPLGNAREAMQAAEAALNAGIARRARKREIDTLFRRYNDAVERYMAYLLEQATESGQEASEGGGGEGRNADEIQALLDAIEEANRLGDTEGARKALAQLAALLENMQIQLTKGGGSGDGEGISEDGLSDEVKDAIEDLADTLGKQRELNDETQDALREQEEQQGQGAEPGQSGQSQSSQSQSGQSGQSDQADQGEAGQNGEQPSEGAQAQAKDSEQLGRDQAALEGALDALEKALREGGTDLSAAPKNQNDERSEGAGAGEPSDTQRGQGGGGDADPNAPPNSGGSGGEQTDSQDSMSAQEALDAVRDAMKQSQDALSGEDFAAADKAQKDAIAALRQAAEGLISQADMGEADQAGGKDGDGGQDPLGRDGDASGEGIGEGDTDIPLQSDRQRARDLIEDLRRRASEQEREQEELNYLERLLERF